MGGTQSRDTVVVQTTVNNAMITQKLDTMSWFVIALIVIVSLATAYQAWRRCIGTAKSWLGGTRR